MSIKIKSLSPPELVEDTLNKDYLYKDLELDLNESVYLNRQLNKTEKLSDVSAIYDAESVKNAVATAFVTTPGDKILNPTYGVDLRQYLFEPLDDFVLDIIRDDITTKLPLSEPRVEIVNVVVNGDEDNQTISVELQINVPSLDIYGLSIKTELNSTGYTIL